ncbi:MAG: cupin domain-containing protein [Actinobacteria bacterium]|nr:cupin domain-containing protein [Actinomycetota bacterium]
MVPEAPLERTENGVAPGGDGWFVLNVREAHWFDGGELGGLYVSFESEKARFAELGFGLGILRPGEANALYHGEEAQENFLVLAGECLLLIEGEERTLRAWDFVHCPSWTEHIFVGAGDGPCLVVGVGARRKGRGLRFPVSELALRYGAGADVETTDSREAYAGFSEPRPIPCPPEFSELTR